MLRYSVACLFWLPFLLRSIIGGQVDRKIWRRALIVTPANVIMQTLWIAGFYYLEPAFMVLLTKSSVIWIAAFSLVFFAQERPLVKSKRFWLGMSLCTAGIAGVLVNKQGFAESRTITGIVITLAASFMWGVYTVLVKTAFKDTDSRNGFAVVSIYTVFALSILAFIFGRPVDCVKISAWLWACVVISGVLNIGVGHVLYYASIKRIGATIPSLVLLLQPFIVFAISKVVFGESLNRLQWTFGVVLLAGAAMAIWAQQHLRPNL